MTGIVSSSDFRIVVVCWILTVIFSARLIKADARQEKRDFRLGSQRDYDLREIIMTCHMVLYAVFIISIFAAYKIDYRILGIHIFLINPVVHVAVFFGLKTVIRGGK